MSARPTGTVTFLFTDIASSTRLWERHAAAMAGALDRHDALSRTHFERFNGYVFATGGDGFAVAFARPSDALDAAIGLQQAFAAERWPDETPVSVRMAIHTGEAVERGGDYFGSTVNTAGRLLGVGHGGQILLSDTTRQLVRNGHRLRDLGTHRLRDLGTPVRVWQVGDEHFGPLRSVDATPGNLPSHLSPLIGRDVELATLLDAMATHRLVTLTGVGGVGKTRLALAAAGEVAPERPDGCWFVDLSVREADDDLAAAVSVAIGADATATDARLLFAHLRERRSLLVVDNCEHLVDTAAALAEDLLATTSHVDLLVTSREPLGIDGEHVHRVRSLALPDDVDDVDHVVAAPAVVLFLERAREAGAALNAQHDAGAVVAICRHLDGIPLAIELAAARTRSMSATEILERIDERFRLLGGGRRSRERHRTLAATVQWSHDLLTADERQVWRRLAVFTGGFDLDAAEVVVSRADTIEMLLSLVDKSMVQVDTTSGRARYSMLETLRQFAADRLVDAGEVDTTRARHADHYLRRVGVDSPSLRGPGEHLAWEAIARDRDNVVVAAERLLESGRAGELIDTITAAPSFWVLIAPTHGRRLLEIAVAGVADPPLRARALSLAAFLAWEEGDPSETIRLARAHLDLAAALGDPPGGWGLAALLIADNFDRTLAADGLLEVAVATTEREADDFLCVVINAVLAGYLHRRGDPQWRERFDVAERAAARLDSSSAYVTIAVSRAAEELRIDGGEDAALDALLAVEHRVGQATSTVSGWYHLFAARARFDRYRPRAIEHLRDAIRIADHLGSAVVTNIAYEGMALAWALEGRLEDAALLRSITRSFFDSGGRARGEVNDRVRVQLDDLLARGLEPPVLEESEHRAASLSRPALIDLLGFGDRHDTGRAVSIERGLAT